MNIQTKDKKIELSIGEILFYIFWAVMAFSKGMGWYEGMFSYNLCLVLSMLCICLKIIWEKHSLSELLVIVLLVTLGVAVYLCSGEKAPLIYIFLVIGMKNISVDRVFKLGLFVWLFCFGYRGFIEVTGISKGFVFAHEKLGLGVILRWGFGYPHPNVMHITYAVIVAFILYLTKKRGKELLKLLVLLFVGNCIVFLYSVSYTGFLLTSICLVIFLYFVSRRRFSKVEKFVSLMVLPCCVLFSVLGPVLTGEGSIFEKYGSFFNNLFNSRFHASRLFISTGITLFGDRIDLGAWALDSSYVSLLMKNGILFFVVVIVSYFLLIYHCICKAEWKKLALILSFCIAGISEPFLFNTSFKNLVFIFLGEYFYQKMKEMRNKKEKKTILGWGYTEKLIEFPVENFFGFLQKVRGTAIRLRKKIFLTGILCGIVSSIFYICMASMPDSIYVGVSNTDCSPREKKFLDIETLPEDFNSVIYEYHGSDSPLYEFTGNMLLVEQIRGIVGWGIIGSFMGSFIFGGFYIIKVEILGRSKKSAKV